MASRLQLQTLLEELLESENVYFQPPSNIELSYPCIIYERNRKVNKFADDNLYLGKQGYSLTVIDRDPDSEIPGLVSKLQYCVFDRHFKTDNLNHDVFNIYF